MELTSKQKLSVKRIEKSKKEKLKRSISFITEWLRRRKIKFVEIESYIKKLGVVPCFLKSGYTIHLLGARKVGSGVVGVIQGCSGCLLTDALAHCPYKSSNRKDRNIIGKALVVPLVPKKIIINENEKTKVLVGKDNELFVNVTIDIDQAILDAPILPVESTSG